MFNGGTVFNIMVCIDRPENVQISYVHNVYETEDLDRIVTLDDRSQILRAGQVMVVFKSDKNTHLEGEMRDIKMLIDFNNRSNFIELNVAEALFKVNAIVSVGTNLTVRVTTESGKRGICILIPKQLRGPQIKLDSSDPIGFGFIDRFVASAEYTNFKDMAFLHLVVYLEVNQAVTIEYNGDTLGLICTPS
jgi:hypothetical protein